jgi:hypothetical protein
LGTVRPQIGISGNKVYVIWQDPNPVNFDIFFRRSTDTGANFESVENLSSNVRNSEIVQITVTGENVYVVWNDSLPPGNSEVFFRASMDRGASFGATENLSSNAGRSDKPQISASGNNVYVVWEDDTPFPGPGEVFFRASTDLGANFAATENLSNNVGDSSVPDISASGTNVYVVWQDFAPGNNDLFFTRSADGGATFDSAQNISDNSGTSRTPLLTASVKGLYVVWTDNTAAVNSEIFFRASLPSLIPQEAIENLIQTVGDLDAVNFRVETALITQLRIELILLAIATYQMTLFLVR